MANSVSSFNNLPSATDVAGAYYGPPPPGIETVEVPKGGSLDLGFNMTAEQMAKQQDWDYLWTVYYNSPDHQSVFEGDFPYQFNYSYMFTFRGAQANVSALFDPQNFTVGPGQVRLNDSVSFWDPGDSVMYQGIEREADNVTATGVRAFSRVIKIVASAGESSTTGTSSASSTSPAASQTASAISTGAASHVRGNGAWKMLLVGSLIWFSLLSL